MPINKVGTKGIADGSIATADLNDGLVTSAKLQNGAVTNVKLTNTAFTLSGTSVSLGGSATFNNKFVNWQSVIVADGSTGTTGVSGRGYFINTTSAAHIFTLPSSATRGDNISIKDYAGTFATNNLTIARNGHNIQGVANNSLITTNRASVVLVYVDVTRGWEFVEESNVATLGQALFTSATGGTIVTDGDYKVHSFTGDGCFVVSTVGNSPVAPTGGPANVDILVVAGGGGGRSGFNCKATGAGGGGGGVVLSSSYPISITTFPISIGAGGSIGTNGTNSTALTLTSVGGGKGGTLGAGPCNNSGGSGGGAGQLCFSPTNPGATKSGGSGNQTCQPGISGSSGFGNPGGGGKTLTAPFNNPQASGSGGGGGAGTAGSVGTYAGAAGNGGNGKDVTPVFGAAPKTFYIADGPNAGASAPGVFAGGGGGGGPTGGTGGTGGGGDGGSNPGPSPTSLGKAGIANTGGGGGGGQNNGAYSGGDTGAAGGSGIVLIRYKFQ